MKFTSKGLPLDDQGMDEVCDLLGVAEPEIWAILTVETRGFGFFNNRSPQILFERHIFHRLTNGRYDDVNPSISHGNSGGYDGGTKEYKRLRAAMKLDKEIALQSASWGIGQIMGFNHHKGGFSSVSEFVKRMVRDENSQLVAMAQFIQNSGLASALQRINWVSFARGYNGKNFKKNEYDTRLAAAYAKYRITLPDLSLRRAQAALIFLGYNPGPVDGLRGRRTRSALMLFQEQSGIAETGELDGSTEVVLCKSAFGE